MAQLIQKKAYTKYFDQVLVGEKTFDLRIADFDCQPGDILELIDIDNDKNPTGRTLRKRIGTVVQTKDVQAWYAPEDVENNGYVVMSLLDEEVQ